jgi:succinyl-diaminopimelate desuccinylase
VLLAGHLDTVPAQDNLPGGFEDGWVVGLGASDMKGGLAVMIELARWAVGERGLSCDLGFLFFVREELSTEESALPRVFAEAPLVLESNLVVMLEPTDNEIHAGCLGNLNATILFHGESAHSARPWQGVNAIDLAVEGLRPVVSSAPVEVEVGGLTFVEVLSATRIHGGIADNVIPDSVEVRLNYRYAPSRTRDEAEARLRALVGMEVEVTSNSPPAHVAADSALVRRLRDAGSLAVEAKQAWTPVAEFSAQGLDAVNFGPGATRYAHRRDERVEVEELERSLAALRRFASG